MFFRKQFIVEGTGFVLPNAGPIHYYFSDPQMEVTFQNAKPQFPYDANALCIASCEREVDETTRAAFDALANDELPEGTQEGDEVLFAVFDADGTGDALEGTPASFLPQPFRDFVVNVLGEMDETVRRTASAMRWRFNSQSGHNPVRSGLAEWSHDHAKWYPMPTTRKIYSWPRVSQGIDGQSVQTISEMLDKDELEPLSYELFREGYQQLLGNPRSALIVCFAAVEVGAKECIQSLMPGAAWLLDNVQSPNVHAIVSKYLPTLPSLTPDKKFLVPSEVMLRDLKLGMETRNKLIHLGRIPEGKDWSKHRDLLEDVEKRHAFFTSIRDILWVLSYNQGFDWAANHLSEKAQKDLGLMRTVFLGK